MEAFRGEIERALALGAEYLVVHPGSYRGMTRKQGLELAAKSIQKAIAGLPWQQTPFHILIENTAGSEHSLGGSFEQVAELIEHLRPYAPVARLPRHLPHPCLRLRHRQRGGMGRNHGAD